MHLKSLTLRGFKSFASATTLNFEPGITCFVGPNGSGKSNVVDAVAWVMGEQGAKSLRGGKMDDVIFAGTATRPPLGRAEVSLTIDNTDGLLPIDYTEVTLSRTLFRSGGSEYAINGQPCRLLDIQELLSDTGMGREMHVIVGQGQLDAILRAGPDERRGFIEEAAGVLKHRKRKEKALRKLDSTQAHITRLTDLAGELRRQLGPLGRQAEVARNAATIQADLRDAKARLLADDLAAAQAAYAAGTADESVLADRRTELENRLSGLKTQLANLEADTIADAPALTAAHDVWYRLTAARDRMRATAALAQERQRLLGDAPVHQGANPDDLTAQASRIRASLAELGDEVTRARSGLAAAVDVRTAAEAAAANAERAVSDLLRAAADRREGVATLAGKLAAQRSRIEATGEEIARLSARLADTQARAQAATAEFAVLESEAVGAEQGEISLDAEHEAATQTLAKCTADLAEKRAAAATAETDRAQWRARLEALELSISNGTGALLASDIATRGSLAGHLTIEPGYEAAIASALGPLVDAVAVDTVAAAVDAIRYLRDDDAGQATFVVAATAAPDGLPDPPGGTRWATDVIAAGEFTGAIQVLLAKVVVVDDLAQARAVLANHPDLTVVTTGGDLLSTTHAAGGSVAPSTLHLQAAVDDARRHYEAALADTQRLTFEIASAERAVSEAQEVYDTTLDHLNESDATLIAVTERLGSLGASARAAEAEAEQLTAAITTAEQALAGHTAAATDLARRLEIAEAEPVESDQLPAATAQQEQAALAATAARAAETDARLKLRTAEERERALAGRAESLERAAAVERAAIAKAEAAARRRAEVVARAAAVFQAAEQGIAAIGPAINAAEQERFAAQEAAAQRAAALGSCRTEHDQVANELAKLSDTAHRAELVRTEHALRIETLTDRAIEELGLDPAVLVEEYGPHVLIPLPDGESTPYLRADQEKRLKRAERDLAVLGRVNPLALEEFTALEERHKYLTDQLADLQTTRADLLSLVADIDDRVVQVFAEAFADTATQFEQVFAQLFPGGEGRLVLTEPDNLQTTGVDVEARPAGKKVKRLSLLSGGERALTATALLIAIFKARPSPFYVLDEIEAALDDVNLQRLLTILRELQDNSQLIVVTHQKRTMEIADALYGITMRSGVSEVISQRIDE